MQNRPVIAAVKPTAPEAARPAPAPGLLPAGYAAGYSSTSAPPAAFARVVSSQSTAPVAARPLPYYTAHAPAPTPAPPLGGTTVPPPVIAPSIIGPQPTMPTPPMTYYPLGTSSTAAPAWSDGSLPMESLPLNVPTMTAAPATNMPVPAPSLGGQPVTTAPTYAQPTYDPSTYGAPSVGDPSCQPESDFDPASVWQGLCQRNCGPWFASVAFMMMTRDAPNNVGLSYLTNTPQITVMNSETATSHDWEEGGEIRIGRAIGQRWAVEGVYWGIDTFSEQIGVHSQANELNSRLDFHNLFYHGAPVSDVFDNARDHRFYRQDIFENIEINLMQQALQVDARNRWGMTSFIGVRYFRFDELVMYEASAANVNFGTTNDMEFQTDYSVKTNNRMVGGQIGARGTLNLGCKFRLFAIPRFGLYANNISMSQKVCGVTNMNATKVDATLMGQLDVGASYQVLPCISVFTSYRGMGFSGVATGDDNISRSFQATADVNQINSAGSLILHGWQSGIQVQF